MAVARLLTINTGSSSLKAGLYHFAPSAQLELTAQVDRIGLPGSRLRVANATGTSLLDQADGLPTHTAAVQALLTWLRGQADCLRPDAVGHRIVHGGSQYREPHVITEELVAALRDLVPVDPDHLPQALEAVEAAGQSYSGIPQVACFDTAFHRNMPAVARTYPLPRAIGEAGVVRYGFHGLSYEFIMHELVAEDATAAAGRVIIAHLGNGASMAAVRGGVGIDTTMGFTPTGGLMMATRTGDLDPGVLLYLRRTRGLSVEAVSDLVNKEAGLLGVSGISSDMKDLLDREGAEPRAAEAVELFCYLARKSIGALAAVLGGLDTLIFTAGIGEHAPSVRARVCAGLDFLGVRIDPERNAASAPIISRAGAPATVRVMRTDEDLMIARHTHRLLVTNGGGSDVSV
jgi:acetate kinase